MAYTLQAVIGEEPLLRACGPNRPLVPLAQGKALVPLLGGTEVGAEISFLPLTDEGAEQMPESIAAICRELSTNGRIAYVEAEYFGGEGVQAAVLWENGLQVGSIELSRDAINRVLRVLGVGAGGAHDEFEALNLGQHRRTEEWALGRG
jgi:hypothetical protein